MLKKIIKILTISLCAATLVTAMPFTVTAALKKLSKGVKVGDTVSFGEYEKEKIEWQVLEKNKNKALLISKKSLDVQTYNEELKDITWEKCTLRKWLNKEFIQEAFNDKESKRIQNSKIKNEDNKEFKTEGGKNTTDKVFLLSIDEAKKYFKTDKKRKAGITNYGIKRIAELEGKTEEDIKAEIFSEDNKRVYWLRSSGCSQFGAADVRSDGSVNGCGVNVSSSTVGVRPVIWVKLS